MLEAAEQWSQLLKDLENEEIPEDEKMRLFREFFQLEEGEPFFLPLQETNKKKKRTTSTIPQKGVKS